MPWCIFLDEIDQKALPKSHSTQTHHARTCSEGRLVCCFVSIQSHAMMSWWTLRRLAHQLVLWPNSPLLKRRWCVCVCVVRLMVYTRWKPQNYVAIISWTWYQPTIITTVDRVYNDEALCVRRLGYRWCVDSNPIGIAHSIIFAWEILPVHSLRPLSHSSSSATEHIIHFWGFCFFKTQSNLMAIFYRCNVEFIASIASVVFDPKTNEN